MDMRFVPASDRSLLIYTADVPRLLRAIESAAFRGLINLHPGYASLLVVFDPVAWEHEGLADQVRRLCHHPVPGIEAASCRLVEIPVAYDGPDLQFVAEVNAMSAERVIQLHSGTLYTVAFLGFLPGFGYLRGLPLEIATPRLDVPRRRVEAGSVGIGGSQTGVYPSPSPGGWRLIGRTSAILFDPDRNPASLLHTGDQVRFVAV